MNFDQHYGQYYISHISTVGDWFNDLFDQFKLDCNPEDVRWCKEAKKCYRKLKRKGKQVDKLMIREGNILIK